MLALRLAYYSGAASVEDKHITNKLHHTVGLSQACNHPLRLLAMQFTTPVVATPRSNCLDIAGRFPMEMDPVLLAKCTPTRLSLAV
jgi:hypothetical protein